MMKEDKRIIGFLTKLFNTNIEFTQKYDLKFFNRFYDQQNPYVTILKCSDSRVQMESFSKEPQNNIFTVRNIGNQLLNSEGSVDFGVLVLKTPILLIVGHSACGAVKCVFRGAKTNIESIDQELAQMHLSANSLNQAIIENIHHQTRLALDKYHELVSAGKLTIFGAIYDFQNQFNHGFGKVILTSVNSEINPDIIREKYGKYVKHMNYLIGDYN